MPLDRLVELRIFDRRSQVPRGSPALVETVWADRQGASVEQIQDRLASLDGVLFVDYRLRWRQDIESIIPGYLRLRDEAGNEYEVNGISTEDSRRSYLVIHCSRAADAESE